MKKTLMAAGAVAVLMLTGACGGDGDGGRPSSEDLAKLIRDSDDSVTKKQADCLADLLVDSDLSDEGLTAAAEQETDYKPSKDDEKALTEVLSKATEDCLS